jgi:hypothetical protein
MKIIELEENYRRLLDELHETRGRVFRIAADQGSLPADVRLARQRADELKGLVRRARAVLARALFADGSTVVQIAGRLGTTLVRVNEMLAAGGNSGQGSFHA